MRPEGSRWRSGAGREGCGRAGSTPGSRTAMRRPGGGSQRAGVGQPPSHHIPSFLCPAPILPFSRVCDCVQGSEREGDRQTYRPTPGEGERGARNSALPASLQLAPSPFSLGLLKPCLFSGLPAIVYVCTHLCGVCMACMGHVYVVHVV